MTKTASRKRTFAVIILSALAIASFTVATAYAATSLSIGGVASQVTASMGDLARLITAAAYVAGFGFAVGAVLKFKAHKDNPTQIPVGTPIALIFIAAALIFLPSIFGVAGETIFGGAGTPGGIKGVTSF